MSRLLGVLAGLAIISSASVALAAQDKPLDVVPSVDFQQYAGEWFEIARLPNRFQDECAGDVVATYTPRPDGRINVINRCRQPNGRIKEAEGVARRVDGKPSSVLKVRFAPGWLSFLPNVWGDYQVIALDADYTHVLVGSPDRKYLWVLARKPVLDQSAYDALLAKATSQGFDVSKMMKTEQSGK